MLADIGRAFLVLIVLMLIAILVGAVMSRAELQRYMNIRKM